MKARLPWLLLALAACDDAPPPPATTTPAENSALAPAPPKVAPLPAAAQEQDGAMMAETSKRLRAELCYLGLFGASYARDAYRESVGDQAPSATHLPAFGDYAEHHPGPDGRVSMAAKMGRLPFERHLRACGPAATLAEGKWPAIDKALAAAEPVATEAARVLSQAARYIARKEYERDGFEQGRDNHRHIEDGLATLDETRITLGSTLLPWLSSLDPTADDAKRDAVGQISAEIVSLSRALLVAVLEAKGSDAQQIAREALETKRRQLAGQGPRAKGLGQDVDALLAAVKKLPTGELSSRVRYEVVARYLAVLEGDFRLLLQTLGENARPRDPRQPRERLRMRQPESE